MGLELEWDDSCRQRQRRLLVSARPPLCIYYYPSLSKSVSLPNIIILSRSMVTGIVFCCLPTDLLPPDPVLLPIIRSDTGYKALGLVDVQVCLQEGHRLYHWLLLQPKHLRMRQGESVSLLPITKKQKMKMKNSKRHVRREKRENHLLLILAERRCLNFMAPPRP